MPYQGWVILFARAETRPATDDGGGFAGNQNLHNRFDSFVRDATRCAILTMRARFQRCNMMGYA
jgi:hypothetical protein